MGDKGKSRWLRNYKTFIRLYRGRHDIIAEQNEEGEYQVVPGEGLTFERFHDLLASPSRVVMVTLLICSFLTSNLVFLIYSAYSS